VRRAFELALSNVARFGDTDVLPYPIENHIFFDRPEEAVALLEELHAKFSGERRQGGREGDREGYLDRYPPFHEGTVTAVGHFGYRWATQIDPLWNAYLLALVVSIGEDLEGARLPVADGVVFSYRFKPDPEKGALFDPAVGWEAYQRASLDQPERYAFVLACDISDFYPRVYHHPLENALRDATADTEAVRRIMALLKTLSRAGESYGLPVGGPAARLLAEVLLNSVDRLLVTEDVRFCRFADDYHLFAETEEQAYRHLVFLTRTLYENLGLTLQKAKTRLMSAAEFRATSPFARDRAASSEEEAAQWGFLNLKVHYEPYSQTAAADYEALKQELEKHDVLGMLARELEKSRPDPHLTRRLLAAVEHLEAPHRNQAVRTLLKNLVVLYPLLSQALIVLKSVVDDLDGEVREAVFVALRKLIEEDSRLVGVPAHLAYAVRVLARDASGSAATDQALARAFRSPSSLVRRDAILAMARRGRRHWLADLRGRYPGLGPWERRALLVASYVLGDAGSHWRDKLRDQLWPLDRLALRWAGERKDAGGWEVPL
jgi:hypothetical protein